MASEKRKIVHHYWTRSVARNSIQLPILPQEVIIEVLLRLPVKSLLKFRCVSKSWLPLISSSQFAKAHLNISSKKNKGEHDCLVYGSGRDRVSLRSCYIDSFMHDIKCVYSPEVEGYGRGSYLFMLGSCNGLICMCMYNSHSADIFLWNPSLRKSMSLPKSGSKYEGPFITYGFGYNDLTDDYVFVKTFGSWNRAFCAKVKIYSLKTNYWRQIKDWPGDYIVGCTSVFAFGAFHWTTKKGSWNIISLNLATETYGEVPLPKSEVLDGTLWLKVLKGCFCVVYNFSTYLDVWIMKEYGVSESWTKLACVTDISGYHYRSPMPLYVSQSGTLIMNYGSTLKLYNSSDHTSNSEEIHSYDDRITHDATTYMESLLLPTSEHEGNRYPSQWVTKDWDFEHIV